MDWWLIGMAFLIGLVIGRIVTEHDNRRQRRKDDA
jgi:uncharacterized membrane-anchored protein YhcB (DUF1043 family)